MANNQTTDVERASVAGMLVVLGVAAALVYFS